MLLVFNILFMFMLFPLRSSLKRKVVVIVAGNFFCFVWSASFFMFVLTFASNVSRVLLAILSPMLNLLWTVSFWSVSLTFLVGSKKQQAMEKG